MKRHIRGKWVCAQCQTLTQAPLPAQIIDKGVATAGLLAQVMVVNSPITVCHECNGLRFGGKQCFTEDEGRSPRSRLAGAGFKPPQAA